MLERSNKINEISRWLPAWQWVKMCPHYFPMWSIACKPTIWSWRNWCICIWWIMQNLNPIWPSWQSIHSLRYVFSMKIHLSNRFNVFQPRTHNHTNVYFHTYVFALSLYTYIEVVEFIFSLLSMYKDTTMAFSCCWLIESSLLEVFVGISILDFF